MFKSKKTKMIKKLEDSFLDFKSFFYFEKKTIENKISMILDLLKQVVDYKIIYCKSDWTQNHETTIEKLKDQGYQFGFHFDEGTR
jgi:hypothetical protein